MDRDMDALRSALELDKDVDKDSDSFDSETHRLRRLHSANSSTSSGDSKPLGLARGSGASKRGGLSRFYRGKAKSFASLSSLSSLSSRSLRAGAGELGKGPRDPWLQPPTSDPDGFPPEDDDGPSDGPFALSTQEKGQLERSESMPEFPQDAPSSPESPQNTDGRYVVGSMSESPERVDQPQPVDDAPTSQRRTVSPPPLYVTAGAGAGCYR